MNTILVTSAFSFSHYRIFSVLLDHFQTDAKLKTLHVVRVLRYGCWERGWSCLNLASQNIHCCFLRLLVPSHLHPSVLAWNAHVSICPPVQRLWGYFLFLSWSQSRFLGLFPPLPTSALLLEEPKNYLKLFCELWEIHWRYRGPSLPGHAA